MANAATIGALRVVLGLDTAQFESGLQKARGTLAGFNPAAGIKPALKEVGAALDDVAGHAGILGRSLTNMGAVGVAAGVSLGALVIGATAAVEALKQTRAAIDDLAEVAKVSKEIGVSTDFLQQFNFAAKQSDIDVGAADEALKGLNISLGQVQSGLARAQTTKAFAAIGFTPEQTRQFRDVGDFFPVLVERISAVGNAAEQAAIAKRLGISELLPLLQEGRGNFNSLAQAAKDLGIVVSATLVEKSEDAKKKLSELDAVMKAQKDETFAEYAKELITIETAFLRAETAGIKLLAALVHIADSPAVKIAAATALGFAQTGTVTGAAAAGGAVASQEIETARLNRQFGKLPDTFGDEDVEGTNRAAIFGPRPPVSALVPGAEAHSNATASDEAIARAAKEELQARIALTADIVKLTALRLQEVDQETAAANKKLQDEANAKRITQAAADTAIASNNAAALEKKALITRQALFDTQNNELAHRETIEQYAQQAAQIEAGLAKSLDARQGIETQALADQQKLDRDKLATSLSQQLTDERITRAKADEQIAAQKTAQDAQVEELAHRQAAERQQRLNDLAEASIGIQIQLAQSQADTVGTETQRAAIQLHILELTQQLERLKLQEIIDNPASTAEQVADAQRDLAALLRVQANQQRAAVGGVLANYDKVSTALGDFSTALKNHDWVKAFESLDKAVAALVTAFNATGSTLESKIGAVAGLGGIIGSAVGGPAGSAISGAAGGAATGASIGSIIPGVGTAIGAVVGGLLGGIAGLFGGNSQKKAQDAANAQAAAQAAAAHATAVANEKLQLQIQLLLAQGKAEDALALQRQAAIASVNAENAELEGQLFDVQQAADKAAAAAQVAAQAHDLQIKLLTAEGDATGALAATRKDELAALDASNRDLQQQIYNLQDLATARAAADQAVADSTTAVTDAQAKLSAARDAEASALNATIQQFQGFADSLNAYAASLTGAGLAANLSYAQADLAERQTAAAARLGDTKALGALQAAGDAFLTASKSQAHSLVDFLRDQARVKADAQAAADTATRQVSIAQQQLDALNAQVDGLVGVKDAVLTIPDAIAKLQSAVEAQTAAQAAQAAIAAQQAAQIATAAQVGATLTPPPPPSAAAPSPASPDVPSDIAAQIQALIAGGSLNGISPNLQQFATGGSFGVGGSGGPDSQLFNMALSPGEVVNVTRPGDIADLADKMDRVVVGLDRFREEQKAGQVAIALATGRTARILENVTQDGTSITTSAA